VIEIPWSVVFTEGVTTTVRFVVTSKIVVACRNVLPTVWFAVTSTGPAGAFGTVNA
jgi:hypothetical protein